MLSLKEANGTTAGCAAIGSGKWDVLLDLPNTAYSTVLNTFNNTTTGATALSGISAAFFRQVSGAGGSYINFSSRSAEGILLSGSTAGPILNSTDTITLTAQMFKGPNGVAVTAGTYTANVPLTVLYR